jgi:hypothetical protein
MRFLVPAILAITTISPQSVASAQTPPRQVSTADAEAAAQSLAKRAPSPKLKEAASSYLELMNARNHPIPTPGGRGTEKTEAALDKLQKYNSKEIVASARALPTQYHDATFQCIEDAETCDKSTTVPKYICAGATLFCLASHLNAK